MSTRKQNPADQVVAFFESARVEDAETVLDICRGVLKRRRAAPAPRAPREVSTGPARRTLAAAVAKAGPTTELEP